MRGRGIAVAAALGLALAPGARAENPVRQVLPGDIPTTVGAAGPNLNLELVGHAPLDARGNNAALAVAGDCVYVGNRGFDAEKVLVVDVSDPARPTRAGAIDDTALPGATTRELRAVPDQHMLLVLTYASGVGSRRGNSIRRYDISNCREPVFAGALDLGPVRPHEFFVWQDPRRPQRVIAYITTPFAPPQLVVADVSFGAEPRILTVWDGLYPQVVGAESENSQVASYLHSLSVSEDGRTGYLAYWDAGFYLIDTSQVAEGLPAPVIVGLAPAQQAAGMGASYTFRADPADRDPARTLNKGNTHSAVPVPGRPLVALTDEAYDGLGECPYGWFHLVDVSNPLDPRIVSEYRLEQNFPAWCDANGGPAGTVLAHPATHGGTWSAHNLTLTPHLAFVSWHAGGLQVIDTSEPARLLQAGRFSPPPLRSVRRAAELQEFLGEHPVLVWSYPVIRKGLIYVVDIRNGLYVLRYTGPHAEEVASLPFAEGNSNVKAPDVAAATGPPDPPVVVRAELGSPAARPAFSCLLP